MSAAAETGANNGSDFLINRYDDGGNYLDTPFAISRGSGDMFSRNGKVWHSGNDGAGSGLDADLLNGQGSSFYTNIVARLGYTPLNRGGDMATGRLLFSAGAAGNSGIAGSAGDRSEIEVRANGVGAALMSFHRPGAFATYLGLDTDNALKIGGWSLGANAYTIWHAGNDGAGSGLDADLLDGQEGSYYTNIPARLGYTPASRTGDAFTGNVGITNGSILYHEAGVGNYGLNRFQRQNRPRWDLGMANDSETGGNAGSSFYISRFDDAGTNIGTVLLIDRASGEVRLLGQRAWHAGNDGAGSGLDADLLDGLDSSYYTNIVARLGYVPMNSAGDRATGKLVFNANAAGDAAMGGSASDRGEIEIRGNGVGAAIMSFHRPGAHAAYLGLDTDNRLKVGGWSLGSDAYTIWHIGNDGSGSGLDADLLDGRHASDFALNASLGDVWRASNDGAGSGLDADLLDGQDGSYYANIKARLGYSPLNSAGDRATGKLVFNADAAGNGGMAGSAGDRGEVEVRGNGTGAAMMSFHRPGGFASYFGLDVDNKFKVGGWSFGNDVFTLWHVGNDGAGSGLDADLLDGRQASDFVLQSDGARFGSNANGYWERRPNGVIEQWGTINGPFTEGQQSVTFPIPFTNADSVNISATGVNSFANNRYDITIQRVSRSTDGCSLMVQYTAASTSINQIDAIDWRAVGV